MTPLWEVALIVLGCYFIGALNPASLIARVRGVDLQNSGSGNPGATNAARSMGKSVGIAIALLDIAKGYVPVAIIHFTLGIDIAMLAGVAAVLGHVTSPFLRFKGGKGVATAAGAVFATHPLWAVPVLLVFVLTFVLTKRMGIASVAGSLTLIPAAFLITDDWQSVTFAAVLALIITVRHRSNLVQYFNRNRLSDQ